MNIENPVFKELFGEIASICIGLVLIALGLALVFDLMFFPNFAVVRIILTAAALCALALLIVRRRMVTEQFGRNSAEAMLMNSWLRRHRGVTTPGITIS